MLHVLGHDHAEPDETAAMRGRSWSCCEAHHWHGPAPAGFRQEQHVTLAVARFTATDIWMLVAIIVLLLVLGLPGRGRDGPQPHLPGRRPQTLAERAADEGGRGPRAAGRAPGAVHQPAALTVTICQTVQAFLTAIWPTACSAPVGVVVGFVLNVIVFFVLAEALPKTWAVLHSERAALLTARPTLVLVSFPPLRLISRGADRADQRAPAGQGPEAGSVRLASRSCSASSRRPPRTR